MLRWSFIFLVIAVIAAVFGFTGIRTGTTAIAQALFVVCISAWLLLFITGIALIRKVNRLPQKNPSYGKDH